MAKILFLAAACAAVGLGYVWQKRQIYRLGREIKQRELAVEESRRRNMMYEAQAAYLKSPSVLEERVRSLGLNLVSPTEKQVVRMQEPPKTWTPPPQQPQGAAPAQSPRQPSPQRTTQTSRTQSQTARR